MLRPLNTHRLQHEFDGMDEGCLRLSEEHVDHLLDPGMALEAARDGLVSHARGECVQPDKMYTRPRGRAGEFEGGRFIAMPAYVGPPIEAAGLKWIAGFPRNIEMGRPRATAKLILNSVVTGSVIAEMDCAVLSARRTAAIAALSVEQLAVKKPLKVALLGAGPINQAVVEALAALPIGIERFQVYDPMRKRVALMREGFAELSLPRIVASRSAEACVRNADIVVAATTGGKGYLERDWISPGALLVMLSLDDPTEELFLGADKVITDDFDQCNREQKLIHRLVTDGKFSRRKVYADLGEILNGTKQGREDDSEIILVNPMGMAIEDIAVGKAVYVAAKQQGIGDYTSSQHRDGLPEGFIFSPKKLNE